MSQVVSQALSKYSVSFCCAIKFLNCVVVESFHENSNLSSIHYDMVALVSAMMF